MKKLIVCFNLEVILTGIFINKFKYFYKFRGVAVYFDCEIAYVNLSDLWWNNDWNN